MAIELKYWDGRGLMEVPRMILAAAGKFPEDGYVDGRYFRDGFTPSANAKPYEECKDQLGANCGRLPVMSVGGTDIGQSTAINYYLAQTNGLFGKDALEGALIMNLSEHLKDMGMSKNKAMPYGQDVTDEMKKVWFETGAEDESPGPADGAKGGERFFKWWAKRIEFCVAGNGFAFGDKLSLADLLIYNAFAETMNPGEEAHDGVAQHRKEPWSDKAKTEAGLASCPKLKASIAAVASNENIQKWLKTRPKMNF